MKKITAKIGEFTKDGKTVGKYVDCGVIMSNDNGEFVILNPTVDLSGVLMKQRIYAQETGKKVGDSVMCSVFDNSNRQQPSQSSGQQSTNSPAF